MASKLKRRGLTPATLAQHLVLQVILLPLWPGRMRRATDAKANDTQLRYAGELGILERWRFNAMKPEHLYEHIMNAMNLAVASVLFPVQFEFCALLTH